MFLFRYFSPRWFSIEPDYHSRKRYLWLTGGHLDYPHVNEHVSIEQFKMDSTGSRLLSPHLSLSLGSLSRKNNIVPARQGGMALVNNCLVKAALVCFRMTLAVFYTIKLLNNQTTKPWNFCLCETRLSICGHIG